MSAEKPPKLSLEACKRLFAWIITDEKLPEKERRELLSYTHAIWPGRRRSARQELAYPEIYRLVNGVASWQVPLGKRFSVRAASKMIAKILKYSPDALHSGYYCWLRKRTPQELRELVDPQEWRDPRTGIIRKITTW